MKINQFYIREEMQLLSQDRVEILYKREFERYNIIDVRKKQIKFVLFDLLSWLTNFDQLLLKIKFKTRKKQI